MLAAGGRVLPSPREGGRVPRALATFTDPDNAPRPQARDSSKLAQSVISTHFLDAASYLTKVI